MSVKERGYPIMVDPIYVLITVDVENPYKEMPMEFMVYGRFKGRPFGIEKIMEIIERNSIKATFFVDVYDYYFSGLEKIRKLCNCISRRGHDIELHTHPKGCYRKTWLSEHTYEEQYRIISEGISIIEDVIGEQVVAHRAGGYQANEETLRALNVTGTLIDSSNFSKNSGLSITDNKVVEKYGVVEIPVTYFRTYLSSLLGRTYCKVLPFSGNCKYDIDWASLDSLKSIFAKLKIDGVRVINLFLHSFSFIYKDRVRKGFDGNFKNIVNITGYSKIRKNS